MNKHWKVHSFVVGSLLLAAPGILMAREPKLHNPCKDLRNDLDSQVNNLHRQQNDELAQCRQTNGKNADVCRDLKSQQQVALRQLRDQRQSELDRCNPRLNGSFQSGRTESCDSAAYQDNDRYHHKKHPDHPYPPTTNPPNAQNPPKHDGGGHHRDPDAGPTRNAGGSGFHNVALTTAQARPLPALAADLAHLRIPARPPAPVRLLDQVPPALPLLRVRTLRTQATTHRPDQVTVRRLHLRQRHLQGSRIPVEAVVRHNK
jgi:hypothetical protein